MDIYIRANGKEEGPWSFDYVVEMYRQLPPDAEYRLEAMTYWRPVGELIIGEPLLAGELPSLPVPPPMQPIPWWQRNDVAYLLCFVALCGIAAAATVMMTFGN